MSDLEDTRQVLAAEFKEHSEHLKKAKHLQGRQPSESMKRTRKQLVDEFAEAAQASNPYERLMTPKGHQLRVTFHGEPYPPCVVALSALKTISLRDLKLETHHRGRVLIVKTFCEPKRMASIMNAVVDQNGDVDRLALYNIPSSKSINDILPKDAILAVKEPYYTPTIDGRVLIRIDHPSDLIHLKLDSTLIPSNMMPVPMPSLTPTEMKEKGNAAFKRHDWQTAVDCYSTALGLQKHDENLRRTLHCNRSMARINLGYYELALQDALAALVRGGRLSNEHKSLNWKLLYRAGRAAYELGDFLAAKQYFVQSLELSSKDKGLLEQLERTEKRLKEQSTGKYDFTAMSNSATKDHTILDHASFLSNTKVAPAGDRGRGLFATKNLAPGDVIMVEKAFYAVFKREVPENIYVIADIKGNESYNAKSTERIYGIINKLVHNPKQARQFLDLHDGGRFQNKALKFMDGMATVDAFRVRTIAKLNGFACPYIKSSPGTNPFDEEVEEPDGGDGSKATGIWLHASHANHSCIPNGDRSFIGDMMVVRATRDIKVGEEICLTYLTSEDPYPKRKESTSAYNFDCDCPLCEAEKLLSVEVLSKRAEAIEEFNQGVSMIMANGGTSGALPVAIEIAEQLMTQLEDTYPMAQYQHLPRLECVQFSLWLCAFPGTREERLRRALRGLRNLGYFIEIKPNGAKIDRSSAVVLAAGVLLPVIAAAPCLESGNFAASLQLQELKKEVYCILHACDNGMEEMDSQLSG